MRTSSVIWLVIVLILLVGSIYYFWIAPSASNQQAALNATGTGVSPIAAGTSSSSSANLGSASTNTGAGITPGTPNTGSPSPLILNTGSSTALGTYLVAANGMTLYRFAQDPADKSSCYGACAQQWPPYTVTSNVASSSLAGSAAVRGRIGTIMRTDGMIQVTYNDQPLYFWHKDAKPGDTTGQNVAGTWFVVKP